MFAVNASCNAKRVYHFATKHIADTDHNITLLHRVKLFTDIFLFR